MPRPICMLLLGKNCIMCKYCLWWLPTIPFPKNCHSLPKNNYFRKTFAKSTKSFRLTLSWKMCGNIWGKKQGLENGVCCPVTDLWRKLKLQFAKVFFVAKVLAKDCVYLHVLYVCSVRWYEGLGHFVNVKSIGDFLCKKNESLAKV